MLCHVMPCHAMPRVNGGTQHQQVRLNVSRGLGLFLNITGNDVRVKGFSPVKGGEIGPAQACGEIQASGNSAPTVWYSYDTVARIILSDKSSTRSFAVCVTWHMKLDRVRRPAWYDCDTRLSPSVVI